MLCSAFIFFSVTNFETFPGKFELGKFTNKGEKDWVPLMACKEDEILLEKKTCFEKLKFFKILLFMLSKLKLFLEFSVSDFSFLRI